MAANKLATPRNINGVPFDGTQDITINAGISQGTADSRYVQDARLGSVGQAATASSTTTDVPSGCVMTGVRLDVWGSRGTHVTHMRYRPVQKNINGSWITVSQL